MRMGVRVEQSTNLTEDGQLKRLRMGILVGAAAMVLAYVVLALDLPVYWRLLMFVPFAIAASGIAQGLCKT